MQCPESAVQQWFSGDPKGSARELRNSDFGLGIQQSEPGAPATGHDLRITNHEPRITQKPIGRTKPFGRKPKAVHG